MDNSFYTDPGTGTSIRTLDTGTAKYETSAPAFVTGGSAGAWTLQQVDATHGLPVALLGSAAITAAALPLPAGATTATVQAAIAASLVTIAAGSAGVSFPAGFLATQSGSWTVGLTGPLPAGTNVIGHVVVDSAPTTAVTGTFFQATQPVSAASLPLPTGAATSALQTTGNTALGTLALETGGNLAGINTKTPALGQALAAASQPVVLTALQVTALTPPTAVTANAGTNLNTSTLALETGGNLAGMNAKVPALGQALAASAVPVVLTAIQLTALTPPTTVAQSAAATGGATPFRYLAAAAANQDATVVKASAGTLYVAMLSNPSAAARYVKFYDLASGATSASTPCLTLMLPAGGGSNLPLEVGALFANGISFRITTGVADNDTGTATANDVVVSLTFK